MSEREVEILQWARECDGLSIEEIAIIGQEGDAERVDNLVRLGLLEWRESYWKPALLN